MKKADYINRVMLIMNEASLMDTSGNSLLGADAAQVDRYVEGSFVDAWRRCAKVMPKAWFNNSPFEIPGRPMVIKKNLNEGIGYVVLPHDFYLLTSFRMKGWRKSVIDAYIENERTASIQSNDYTRGSEIRPICTISNRMVDGEVKQVLNYYSLARGLSDHVVEEAIYIPVCKPLKDYDTEQELGLDDQIIEPLAYLSASTVFTIFEKYEISKALESRAVEMFPGLQSIRGTNITTKQ